jgi:hypothetical protein
MPACTREASGNVCTGDPNWSYFRGSRYCADRCLGHILDEALRNLPFVPQNPAAAHRVPLGLLLLERQQLTADQLRQALAAQRTAGHGKIGHWLQTLRFVNAEQITSALACQWSCPVLRAPYPKTCHDPSIPLALLEWLPMLPVHYVASTATLHICFSERIDYTVLYAIEQMLRCRTEPCLMVPGSLREKLQKHSERRPEHEIVFDETTGLHAFARSIRSYCQLARATEVRLAPCGPHLWARLLCPGSLPLDLILQLQIQRVAPPDDHPAPAAMPVV